MRSIIVSSILLLSAGCTNYLRDSHGDVVSLQQYGGVAIERVEASSRISDEKLVQVFRNAIESRLCQYLKKDSNACVNIVISHLNVPSVGSQLLGAQGPSASCDVVVCDRNAPDASLGKTSVQVSIAVPGRQNIITSGLIGVAMNATNVRKYNELDRKEIIEILAAYRHCPSPMDTPCQTFSENYPMTCL